MFAGWLDDAGLRVKELHRFPNRPRQFDGALRWDLTSLWRGIQAGMAIARGHGGGTIRSIGVDAWGVDFALLDRDRRLIGDPVTYRDSRTRGVVAQAVSKVAEPELFATTGNQTLAINTLIQLLAMVENGDSALRAADLLLTIPDLFHYWLCGSEAVERTNATTTQCFDPTLGTWATGLLGRFGIPTQLFPAIVEPGTILGTLTGDAVDGPSRPAIPVIAPAAHDTASAVAAVAGDARTAFVSSGSWTLVGVERTAPVLDARALQAGLTNEGGVPDSTLVISVIAGLWLLDQSRRLWTSQGHSRTLDDLMAVAERAVPFASLFDPNHPALLDTDDVPATVRAICRSTGQREPAEPGDVSRAILESLALKIATAITAIESITGQDITTVRVIGGGSRNRLLCQWIANATDRQVLAGPVEATVLGNLLVQAHALGVVSSLDEGRRLVDDTARCFEPASDQRWMSAAQRFAALSATHALQDEPKEAMS